MIENTPVEEQQKDVEKSEDGTIYLHRDPCGNDYKELK